MVPVARREERPSVTLNEVLRLALPAGSAIVAGAGGAQRPISWVQVLRGRPVSLASIELGELIVFSRGAASLLGGGRDLARLAQDLAEAGAGAFAIFQPPERELIAVADASATPLVVIPSKVSPTEVETAVVGLLQNRDEQVRRRVEAIYERLLETLIEEDGASLLAQELGTATGKAIYVFDPFLQLLAAASDAAEIEVPLLRQRLAAQAGAIARPGQRTFRLSIDGLDQPHALLVHPLELRGTAAGFLCLLGATDDFGDLDERVAGRAASVLAIELAKQRSIAEARFRLQGDFLDDLLEGTFSSPEVLAARARVMGYELNRPHLVFVLDVTAPDDGPAAARVRQRFVEAARNELLRFDPAALLRERDGRVTILMPTKHGGQTEDATQAEALRARLASAVDGAPVAVGIGRNATEVSQFPAAYRQAVMALEVARALMGGSRTMRFEDLGVQRLLLQLLGNPELEAYRRDLIGPLEAYDARHHTQLTDTLEVFLACHGNHVRAARELHLHRNTLLYRLDRVRAILGGDLEDPEARLAAQVALKIRHIPRSAWLEAPRAREHKAHRTASPTVHNHKITPKEENP